MMQRILSVGLTERTETIATEMEMVFQMTISHSTLMEMTILQMESKHKIIIMPIGIFWSAFLCSELF